MKGVVNILLRYYNLARSCITSSRRCQLDPVGWAWSPPSLGPVDEDTSLVKVSSRSSHSQNSCTIVDKAGEVVTEARGTKGLVKFGVPAFR